MSSLVVVLGIDERLLKLLPLSVAEEDRSQALVRVLDELLKDVMELFATQTLRASILRVEKNYLVPWVGAVMPASSSGHRFFIGSARGKQHEQGVAGYVYRKNEPVVIHLTWIDDHWEADHASFRFFSSQSRQNHEYRSFMVIPLAVELEGIEKSGPRKFGVLCLDSMTEGCFDSEQIRADLTTVIARRIVAVITLN